MRKRTTPYTPAPSSSSYPVGGISITLLPGFPEEEQPIADKINSALAARHPDGQIPGDEELLGAYAHRALRVGILWDDPVYELETVVPENVMELDAEATLDLGAALYREFAHREVRRLVNPAKLWDAGMRAYLGGLLVPGK